jgi:single-stranded-DNA-specific exonuclease
MPRNDFERRKLFVQRSLKKQVQETIHPDLLLPEIDIDAEILQILLKLTRILKQFEPFGPEYDSCVPDKK